MTDTALLAQTMTQLLSVLAEFDRILKSEEETLTHARIDALAELTSAKLAVSQQLDPLFSQLLDTARHAGMPVDHAAQFTQALQSREPALAQAWQQITQLSLACKARNASNGHLIDQRRQLNDRMIADLAQQQDDSVYGRDGRFNASPSGKPFDKA
ncbi:flagella synthesis protein FlgN [Chitinibacteraceae bacterium HSL-7]